MKKSDQKAFQALLNKDTQPRSPKKNDDLSDDLTRQFDDGTALRTSGPIQVDSTQLDSTQIDSTQLTPVAPARDFNKRANSIERDALPAGLFPGTSKKLYDALYLRTRGAVVPVRSIKATRGELMKWASIGGLNTFLSHMKHLTRVGLIVRTFEVGDKEGAIYEVRLPEELDSTQLTSTRLKSTQRDSTQVDSHPKRVHDSTQKVSRVESSEVFDSQGTYDESKTSFKTNTEKTDDDEALADFVAVLRTAAVEVTGRGLSAAERQRWAELAELLATELKIAAGRTTVSSVPAFLTEHLRRRLWKKDAAQLRQEAESAPQPKSGPTIDTSQCPSCFGTGLEYPEGYDKGVRRCLHEKLLKE